MARATSSLPVPLSPVISTGTSRAGTPPVALPPPRVPRAGPRARRPPPLVPVAAPAGDQRGHVLGSHAADGFVHLAHGRAGADDGPFRFPVRRAVCDGGRLAPPPGHFECLANHSAQLIEVERLEQVVVGSVLHGL